MKSEPWLAQVERDIFPRKTRMLDVEDGREGGWATKSVYTLQFSLNLWVGISLLPNVWGCWKIKKKKKRWRLWRFFENFKIQWQWEWFFWGGGDFEGDYFFAFPPYCSPIQNALCLLIPRGAWWATVHEVAKSWIWLSDCTDIPVLQP